MEEVDYKDVLFYIDLVDKKEYYLASQLLSLTKDEQEELMASRWVIENSLPNDGIKTVDLNKDYDTYYFDFLKLGIDLEKEFVSWRKFSWAINYILEQEETGLTKRASFRNYKPHKDDPNMSYFMDKQKQYELQVRSNKEFLHLMGGD